MKIHHEGKFIILISLIILLCLAVIAILVWPAQTGFHYIFYVIELIFFILVVSFFRIPKRNFVLGDNMIISPCDGKVVVIEEIIDEEYFHDKRIQISVFMSPLNVHVNRYPMSGVVKYVKYFPGKYLVAWHPKSSTENERFSTVVEHIRGQQILVKQIAGAVARRIRNYAVVDKKVQQCEELGFIKFGSRVDILLPPGTTIETKIGQKVKGGISVLAKL
jgi:phosphatidylserine decarboxylase